MRLLLPLLLALAPPMAMAQAATVARESSVRAAFLYQFGNYVEWPSEARAGVQSPFVMVVLGDETVRAELVRVARDRQVGGRPVEVAAVGVEDWLAQPDGQERAAVVYVGPGAAAQFPRIVERARRHSVLVVSASNDGLEEGAMIAFVRSGPRLRFDVSLAAFDAAGLRVSSRLLSVARRVEGAPG